MKFIKCGSEKAYDVLVNGDTFIKDFVKPKAGDGDTVKCINEYTHDEMKAAQTILGITEETIKGPFKLFFESVPESVRRNTFIENTKGGGKKSVKWLTTGRKVTTLNGTRTLFYNVTKPNEVRIKKMITRKGQIIATYILPK